MELRHLLYFQKVAEELHFGKAAQKLHISQPPLTRQIKELEKELGVLLFNRNNKRVELTEPGKYFLKECDHLIKKLQHARRFVKQLHDEVSGEFRIGYISSTSHEKLAYVLKDLKARYPILKTRLYELPTQTQIRALEEGDLDVGILRAPVYSTSLVIETLLFDSFVVAYPKEQPIMTIEQLAEEKFISFNRTYAPDYHDKVLACCQRIGFYPEIIHECNNMYSILQFVHYGLGVALVPVSVKQQYPNLAVAFLSLPDIPFETEMVIGYHKEALHVALQLFKDSIRSIL